MNQDPQPPREVTLLLEEWRRGDQHALDRVLPLLYDDLRTLARRALSREAPGHTLQATALVHEAYLRLAHNDLNIRDRAHFLALVARVMRHVLADHAKAAQRAKRGGPRQQVTLDEALLSVSGGEADLAALNEALDRLETQEQRKARAIDLVYFGGMSVAEAAEALDVSLTTLERELKFARAWLSTQLKDH
jgi:RNA polymerase sigma-70 factor, ECF subfamily